MSTSKKVNINRSRMKQALKDVNFAKRILADQESTYRALVRKFLIILRKNGLCTSLAYLNSKQKVEGVNGETKTNEYALLLMQLREWLKTSPNPIINYDFESTNWIEEIANDSTLSNIEYQLIRRELLAFVGYLKQISEGLIQRPNP